MKTLLKKGSILILLGTGGVGKTTVAAALGLAAAETHLDTALITVDPARRLREARPGERVYMRVGDVFKDADIYSLDEWRAARWAAVFGDDDGREDTGR